MTESTNFSNRFKRMETFIQQLQDEICQALEKKAPENSEKTAGNVKKAVEGEPESWKMVVFWKRRGQYF